MGIEKKKSLIEWIVFSVLALIITGGSLYYVYFFTPKNSLELYQQLHFADEFEDVQKLILDGYDGNIAKEDLKYIKDRSANRVGQFTLIEYKEKSFVIMTSPGTERLKILAVDELPEDIREYFLKIGQ